MMNSLLRMRQILPKVAGAANQQPLQIVRPSSANIAVRTFAAKPADGVESKVIGSAGAGGIIGGSNESSWLSKLLVRKIEPTKESHSRMLSDKETIYALHTHNVRPDANEQYIANYKKTVELIGTKKGKISVELIASWTVQVGDMDQCLHLWRYTGGFESIDQANLELRSDADYLALMRERGTYLRSRHLQYLLAFSYWPLITNREGGHIYEMRSYRLKPGTMIEWGNNWARAINFRRNNDEAFAGFFSQIGRLYNVHHIWCYKSLQERKENREAAWRSPGWDECVAYTVPLIKDMHCRILSPAEFSPTQ